MAVNEYVCPAHGYIGVGNEPSPACPLCGEPTRAFCDEDPEAEDMEEPMDLEERLERLIKQD